MNEITNMTVEELVEERKGIPAQMEAEGADLDALEARVKAINAELEKRQAEAEKRKAIINNVTNGVAPTIKSFEENKKMEETRTYGIESAEYRSAWLKSLQGQALSEVEQRAYASTDAHTAIPTLVADKFFEKMKKLAPMLSEITVMHVAGNLKFVVEGTRNAASKHTENEAISAAADTVVTVTLGAYEFAKVIGISKTASAMSADGFEAWLVEMLAGDIARAIDNYILNDSTNGISAITYTTGTNQILNTASSGYTYKNIVDLVALLPAAYDAEAKFLVNKKTLYGQIANITNSQGTPIFVTDPSVGLGRILGYPVVLDDYVPSTNNALYLGKWTDIVGNFTEDMNVESDLSSGFLSGTKNYRGWASFDSKPAKNDGIVRLVSTTA